MTHKSTPYIDYRAGRAAWKGGRKKKTEEKNINQNNNKKRRTDLPDCFDSVTFERIQMSDTHMCTDLHNNNCRVNYSKQCRAKNEPTIYVHARAATIQTEIYTLNSVLLFFF